MKKIFVSLIQFLTASLFLYSPSVSWSSDTVGAALVDCHDGDTCEFRKRNGKTLKVRVFGIDAPESGKPFAKESKRMAVSFLSRGPADLFCTGKSYKRHVCRIQVGNHDLAEYLVEQGLAWDYPKYSKGKYKATQLKAMALQRGVWSLQRFESPTCQRRKSKQAKMMCQINPYFQE